MQSSSVRFVTFVIAIGLGAGGATNGCAQSVEPDVIAESELPGGTDASAGMDGAPSGGHGGTSPTFGGQHVVAGAATAGAGLAAGTGSGSMSSGGAGPMPQAGADSGGEGGSGPASSGGSSSTGSGGVAASGGATGSAGRGSSGSAGKSGVAGSPSTGSGGSGVSGASAGGASPSGGSPSGGTGGQGSVNLLKSASFEAGSVDGWYKRGSATIAVSSEQAHTGTRSLKVTGRTASWHGVEYDVNSIVTPGEIYRATVWARFASAPSNAGLMLTRELTGCNGQEQFTRLDEVTNAPSSAWIELTGALSIPSGCSPTKLAIYIESSDATASYYIDDTSLTAE